MRITNKMMVDNAINHMNGNLDQLNAYQEKVASGKQFQKMSDDPSRAAISLSLRSSLQVSQTYMDTSQNTNEWLSANETALGQMVDIGTRAYNLALSGMSDTLSSDERLALGDEMDALMKQAVEVGNTNHLGKYLFSGFQIKTQPFTLDSNATNVQYSGDNGSIQQDISPGQKIMTNFNGETTFSDFFSSLIQARDALLGNNSSDLEDSLGQITNSLETVKTARTTNGARQRQVQNTLDAIVKTQAELKGLLSEKEDANMAEAISMVNYQQNVYQTVLEVSQRAVSALNLFDILQ